MKKNRIITVQDIPITITQEKLEDYICITDIAAAKSENSRAADIVRNWLRNRSTLEFLATWEEIYNPNFKVFESEHFKKQVGLLTFTPSVSEWVEQTNLDVIISVGYRVKSKRGVEFRRWANSVLKQYILQGYAVNQRRIQQLGEVLRIMKRTENELDGKQILSVIERYNNALVLLDAYDHQTMKRSKRN